MKKRINILIALVCLSALSLAFVGCEEPKEDKTYTVWTDTDTYANFQSQLEPIIGQTLNDGYYLRFELTNAQFDSFSSSLPNEDKHVWTESEIKKWFVGRGFDDATAKEQTSWLVTINHGCISSRTGSTVYSLLK